MSTAKQMAPLSKDSLMEALKEIAQKAGKDGAIINKKLSKTATCLSKNYYATLNYEQNVYMVVVDRKKTASKNKTYAKAICQNAASNFRKALHCKIPDSNYDLIVLFRQVRKKNRFFYYQFILNGRKMAFAVSDKPCLVVMNQKAYQKLKSISKTLKRRRERGPKNNKSPLASDKIIKILESNQNNANGSKANTQDKPNQFITLEGEFEISGHEALANALKSILETN